MSLCVYLYVYLHIYLYMMVYNKLYTNIYTQNVLYPLTIQINKKEAKVNG